MLKVKRESPGTYQVEIQISTTGGDILRRRICKSKQIGFYLALETCYCVLLWKSVPFGGGSHYKTSPTTGLAYQICSLNEQSVIQTKYYSLSDCSDNIAPTVQAVRQ